MVKNRGLTTFTLAMITVSAIVSLRNLPLTAELGSSAFFFLVLAALVFFLPISLATAELASAWPRAGGCYVWVSEAFGKRLGFVALWLSWMASIAWFPAILAFTATMLAHLLQPIYPNLQHNTGFILSIMLLVFWSATIINFFGIKVAGFFSSVAVVLGTIIPGLLIVLLGIGWVISGHPTQLSLSWATLVPNLELNNLSLFSGVVLGFAGVELAAYHIRDSNDPRRSYPRALLVAMVIILLVYILGTFSIATVVPQKDLSIASGLVQAFSVFFTKLNLNLVLPILVAALLLGALAGINSWIAGPAKGMLVVAEDGFLPNWLTKVNKDQVPTNLLLLQATVGSIVAMMFLYLQNNDAAIWFLTVLSAQFTCAQYILVLASALKLRYTQAKTTRPFRAPFIWLFVILGIAACVFSFAISYAPHAKLVCMDCILYCILLVLAFLALAAPAVWLVRK